jgi:fatty acyl-CoA reductase
VILRFVYYILLFIEKYCYNFTVCPALKEPFPGWVDSNLGLVGMLIGAGTGLVRTARAKGDLLGDLLPVDFGANALIAAAWQTTQSSG